MVLPNKSDAEPLLKKLSEETVSDLCWLAGFHAVGKFYEKTGESLDATQRQVSYRPLPEDVVQDSRWQDFTLPAIRPQMERTFRPPVQGESPRDFGHYLNQVAVVYAVAILEAFLEDAYEKRTGGASLRSKSDRALSLPRYIRILAGEEEPPQAHADHVVVDDLRNRVPLIARMEKLAQLRNEIVHAHRESEKINLHVGLVVMPLLEEAVVFVRAMATVLGEARLRSANMDDLARLADLLRRRNAVEGEIAGLIGRPVTTGHLGEYIASRVFRISLAKSASHKGSDGHFAEGPLAGSSVNVKFYLKHDGLLAVSRRAVPDFYLVLTGPKSAAMSSRGQVRPCVIEHAFIFNAQNLITELKASGVKINQATSVRLSLWEEAEVYPSQRGSILVLSQWQRDALGLFGSGHGG